MYLQQSALEREGKAIGAQKKIMSALFLMQSFILQYLIFKVNMYWPRLGFGLKSSVWARLGHETDLAVML